MKKAKRRAEEQILKVLQEIEAGASVASVILVASQNCPLPDGNLR